MQINTERNKRDLPGPKRLIHQFCAGKKKYARIRAYFSFRSVFLGVHLWLNFERQVK